MRKIHRLPQTLIGKIAAGEVIERPAFAVKELIDNAIDAGATTIEIQIEESGLKRITVIDNGEGMSKEDLEICFLPHTTSKLRATDEITGIKTLGFRGEALSAIAAVSHMTLITRHQKDIGGRIIQIRGGIVEDSAPIGSPIGTIITAEGLFYSVPARKKFLKSAQTEFRHITDIVTNYALSFPHIQFQLKHNKKTVLEASNKNGLAERVRSLLGQSISDNFLKVFAEDGQLRLTGFIGSPQIASKKNQKQYLFINNRQVTDKMISLAVKEAFGTLLPSTSTPVYLLHLTIPYEFVDVNVHPRKEQVSISNAKQVFDFVKQTVLKTLQDNNITFQLAKFKQEHSAKLGETTSSAGKELKQTVIPWNTRSYRGDILTSEPQQIHRQYILHIEKDAIYFIDQHAAHERILYEKMKSEHKTQEGKSIPVEAPVTVHLSASDAQTINEFSNDFSSLGFLIEPFQGNSFIITEVPQVFLGRNYEKILNELLSDLQERSEFQNTSEYSHRMIAFLACRAAVKAGDILSKEQLRDISDTLLKTKNNQTCPHGRPTLLTFPIEELHKMFGR